MSAFVVKTNGLTKQFGDLVAVDHITLDIRKGELFGLLGPNGAGKTTFLKLLTGQMDPTDGRAEVLELNPAKNSIDVKMKVGIVPEIGLPPSFLTVKEYMQYIGLLRNISDIDDRTNYWIEYLGLNDVQNTLGKDLSKGTRQKLMIAAGFIHKPPLLFLDEPFIGIDPYYQKKVKEFLLEYLNNGGTIFMCTHILEIAEKMCTRIAIIDHGKIIKIGKLEELAKDGETLDSAFLRYTNND